MDNQQAHGAPIWNPEKNTFMRLARGGEIGDNQLGGYPLGANPLGVCAKPLGTSAPNEPTIVGRVSEIAGYVSRLEGILDDVSDCVLGPRPGESESKHEMLYLDAQLAAICTRTASLVGLARTIAKRFGVLADIGSV